MDKIDFLVATTRHKQKIKDIQDAKRREAFRILREWFHQFTIHDAKDLIAFVDDNHRVNAANYHSPYHMHCMVVNVNDAIQFYIQRGLIKPNEDEADAVNCRTLILAALLHDVGHSGGYEDDAVNVSRSITLAAKCVTKHFHRTHFQINHSLLYELIRTTQFPFVVEPESIWQQIIRDADLLQSLEEDWYNMLYENLLGELNNSREVSFEAFCEGQYQFMLNAKFYTDWFYETKRVAFVNRLENDIETLRHRHGVKNESK